MKAKAPCWTLPSMSTYMPCMKRMSASKKYSAPVAARRLPLDVRGDDSAAEVPDRRHLERQERRQDMDERVERNDVEVRGEPARDRLRIAGLAARGVRSPGNGSRDGGDQREGNAPPEHATPPQSLPHICSLPLTATLTLSRGECTPRHEVGWRAAR